MQNQKANSSLEPPGSWREQMQQLLIHTWRLKVFAYVLGIHVLVFLGLGFTFGFILSGLMLGFIRVLTFFDPAYQLAGRMLGVSPMPSHLAKPPKWWIVYSSVLLLVPALMIAVGIWVLFHAGFCGQNFICILARAMLR